MNYPTYGEISKIWAQWFAIEDLDCQETEEDSPEPSPEEHTFQLAQFHPED